MCRMLGTESKKAKETVSSLIELLGSGTEKAIKTTLASVKTFLLVIQKFGAIARRKWLAGRLASLLNLV